MNHNGYLAGNDGVAVLYNGKLSYFEAYRAKVNESLNCNSAVVGQDHYWQTKEAEKEYERQKWKPIDGITISPNHLSNQRMDNRI
jgi:hypothetical protein